MSMLDASIEEHGQEALKGSPLESPQHDRVAAIIVTYNRKDTLGATLGSVLAQTHPINQVCVVDNASSDGTEAAVRAEFPYVTFLRLEDNLGVGAGLKAGMEHVMGEHDWFWLLDDDSRPRSAALENCLAVAIRVDKCGAVGLAGGTLNWGIPNHSGRGKPIIGKPLARTRDFLELDGSVVSKEAARQVGYPRQDLFMMMEGVEYTRRLARAGWQLLAIDEDLIDRGHLGSAGSGGGPPWRGYYQSRNHLLIAMERRSLKELIGWAIRQLKFMVAALLILDRKGERLRLRLLGAWDGFRGRTGRTIDPWE